MTARRLSPRALAACMVARRGDPRWDLVVRGTGAVGLAGIVCALIRPEALPLIWFALVSLPVNGPLSPILPTGFEPLIMEAVKYASVLGVTLVGTAVCLYSEYLNYHLYAWVLTRERFAALSRKSWIQRSVTWFQRAPFTTTVVFAFTPLPFWVARILSIYSRGDVRRFMVATALGRLPRIFLYAWLGSVIMVPGVLLGAVGVGTAVLVIGARLLRGRALLEDAPLAAGDGDAGEGLPGAGPPPQGGDCE